MVFTPPAKAQAVIVPDKHDQTMILTPPPAPPPKPPVTPRSPAEAKPPSTPAAPAPTAAGSVDPLPPAPVPRWSGRKKSDSIGDAFDRSTSKQDEAPSPPTIGVSTAEDLAAVRGVFNEVAAVHVAQVRDVMLELRYGDAEPAWMESTKPALKSLRTMAAQMDLVELCAALDEFCAAVEVAIARRAPTEDKPELLRRYQRLVELIPQAFELDGERGRREPIIIEALLFQVDGVERPTVDKLFAVGLNRLEVLIRANVEDLAAVSGIRHEVAAAIVEQLRSYRAGAQSVLSAPDPMSERRQLHDLLIMMSLLNDDFCRVSTGWTDEARTAKRNLRKQREQAYQRIRVALARLGEREQLVQLERLSFEERIAMIDRYLSAARPHA